MAARRSALDTYRDKRDFARTQEPPPKLAAHEGRRFVVQHHWATRDHYDFRIELDGVLKSWAVTKPPSLDPKVRRLAVRTEDHPVDYASFEGTIPKGEYGGGTVMVWDEGTWSPQQPDPLAALEAGELKVTLAGQRMTGGYVLVRLKPEGKREHWLLIKERDDHAEDGGDLGERFQTSALTGRTRQEIERGAPGRKPPAARKRPAKVRRTDAPLAMPQATAAELGRLPAFVPPMLCEPHAEAPAGEDWLHEIKYDGYRVQAAVSGKAVKLYSREGLDWTGRFGRVAPALSALGLPPSLIDGEMVVLDATGVSRFSQLVDRLDTDSPDIAYVAFDLLADRGRSIAHLPLTERKARLADLLARAGGQRIRIASWIDGDGPRVFADAVRAGAEGVVSKRIDSPWRSGRSGAWRKIKADTRDDVIVVGYMPSDRRPFASLCVAFETKDGLAYAGNVGTGFSARMLRDTEARLARLTRKGPPPGLVFAEKPPRGARWVEPLLRIEVAYTERTPQGHLRHPRFLGFREDRTKDTPAREPVRAAARAAARPAARKTAAAPVKPPAKLAAHLKRISNPDRVVFPEAGVTKAEVAAYYIAVTGRMLPYLNDRPVSFVRAPEGLAGERFFQRHALPGMEKGIASREDPDDDEGVMVIESLDGLVTAAQFGVIEIHGWGATFPDLGKVERVVFDLDPDEDMDFAVVRDAALLVRDLLKAAGLDSVPLLSGGKGVHVVAPLDRSQGWDEVGAFAEGVARGLAAAEPDRFVATVAKAARKGRIFIDYLRNKRTATAIAPWSLRARPGASVAVPVTWKELDNARSAAPFTLREAVARKDPWPRLWRDGQAIPAGALDVLKAGRT